MNAVVRYQSLHHGESAANDNEMKKNRCCHGNSYSLGFGNSYALGPGNSYSLSSGNSYSLGSGNSYAALGTHFPFGLWAGGGPRGGPGTQGHI